jgi:hypothetical protein
VPAGGRVRREGRANTEPLGTAFAVAKHDRPPPVGLSLRGAARAPLGVKGRSCAPDATKGDQDDDERRARGARLFPTYWPMRALWSAAAGESYVEHLVIGAVISAFALLLAVRLFDRKLLRHG